MYAAFVPSVNNAMNTGLDDLVAAYERGTKHAAVPGLLASLYPGAPLLEAAGRTYPLAVWPASVGHTLEHVAWFDSALAASDETFVAADPSYRRLLASRGAGAYDGPCYTLRRFTNDAARLRIDFGRGGYFAALDTGEALAFELYSALGAGRLQGDERGGAALGVLPLRRALHAAIADPLRDGGGRCAALAVATLVAFRARGSWWVLLRRCAGRGNARVHGRVHVLPSGMLQPRTLGETSPSVAGTVYTELLEELFGRSEHDATDAWLGAREDPALTALSEAGARLELLGMSVDLATLRPELLTLLTIPEGGWAARVESDPAVRYAPNAEWGPALGGAGAPLSAVPLLDDESAQAKQWRLGPADMVPPGAGAFWLGARRLWAERVARE